MPVRDNRPENRQTFTRLKNCEPYLKYLEGEIRSIHGGIQYRFIFPNGYGASVVKHKYSNGGPEDLFELAVLKNGNLCYDTPITSDVEGNLTNNDVLDILRRIQDLPEVENGR